MGGQQPNMPKPLPDLERCRTDDMLSPTIMICLVDHPEKCPFVREFGERNFCRHPDRKKFLAPRKPK